MGCVTNAVIKFNGKVEQFFYKLGGLIATYPLLSISFTIIFWGGFGFGLIRAKTENDIYKLWIEDDSRLHAEREFDALHFPFSTRTEFMIATPPAGQNLMTEEVLSDWLTLAATLPSVTVNYTGSYGVFAGNHAYEWEDVCSRYNTPLQLRPLFSVTGDPSGPEGSWKHSPKMKGFQCSRYTVLDCFQEGKFDFALYPPVVNQFLPNRYDGVNLPPAKVLPGRPSFVGKSDEDLMYITAPSCQNWLGSSFPWNYLYGTVSRVDPADDRSNLTYVGSLQMLALTMAPAQFAANWKLESCIAKAEAYQLSLGATRPSPIGEPGVYQPGNCAYDAAYCLSYVGGAKYYPNGTAAPQNSGNPLWQKDCITQIADCAAAAVQRCVAACAGGDPDFVTQCTNSLLAVMNGGSSTNYPTCITNQGQTGIAEWNATLAVIRGPQCYAASVTCGASTGDVVFCLAGGLSCYANEVAGCLDEPSAGELQDAENIIKAWELAYIDHMAAEKASGDYPNIVVDYYAERSTSDLVDAAGSADAKLIVLGYCLEYLFVGFTFWQYSQLESRLLAGLFGVFLVCVGMIACLGLTVLSNIPLSPTIVQVLPFVGLGLGVDLLFVLGQTYKYRPGWTYAEMGGAMLAYAGPSASLSCITNFFAFLVGYFVPLPSINQFAYAAMIGVACNYFIIIVGWTAILTLDAKRMRANRMDCLFCLRANSNERDIKPNEGNASGFWRHWADVTLSLPGKIVILVVSTGLLVASIIGAQTIEVGLPLADIVPKDHYAHEFLYQRESNFGAFSAGLDIGMDRNGQFIKYDYSQPSIQRQILAMERRFEYVYGYSASLPLRSVSALDQFLIFCQNDSTSIPFLNPNDIYTFPSFNPRGYNPNPFPELQIRLLYPTFFYQALNNWLSLPGSGSALASQFEFDDDGKINALKIQFFQENLFTLPDIIRHIDETREITDTSGLAAFPGGFVYNLYEQYLRVRKYLASHLGYVTLAVTVCLFTFLYNPFAVIILVAVIAVITVEVYGFLHWFGLKLNGVSVVNIIMGVGQSVESTAHITRFFMVFTGTRHERANQALRLMCFPVINGAITTLIGVFPMAFAKFPYFTLYFFHQYVIILVAALFNGICLLPVILALIGPPTLSLGADKAATNDAN